MQGRKGITMNGITILVEHMPYRKKPCLTVQIDNCVYKVASFNSEETADWFLEIAEEMFGREESLSNNGGN